MANARALIDSLRTEVERLITDRGALERFIGQQSAPIDAGEIGRILKDALDAKPGWRENARRVLRLQMMLKCLNCDSLFPGGGKWRKYCNKQCRAEDYRTSKKL